MSAHNTRKRTNAAKIETLRRREVRRFKTQTTVKAGK